MTAGAPFGTSVDVAVVGGGLGGVAAAVRAAEHGASVVLLEAGTRLGGTALFSGGGVHIWGVRTWEEYLARCPNATEPLARTLVERYELFIDWLMSTGAPGDFGTASMRGLSLRKYQIGSGFVPPDGRLRWFDYLGHRLRGLGGAVFTESRVTSLERQDGALMLTAFGPDGVFELRARSVVLAAGGFQANPELLAEHVGSGASSFVPRAVRHDVGDGLRLGLSVGGTTTESMETLYGHLMPAPPCRIGWENYVDPALLSVFYAEHSVLLNERGERFVDESNGELNGETINACAQQPPGGLWVVFDEAIRRRHVRSELRRDVLSRGVHRYVWLLRYVRVRLECGRPTAYLDTLALARDRGAVVLVAETLAELASKLAANGVDGERALRSLCEYNTYADGRSTELRVGRHHSAHALEASPFYALKVAVGVSMTYGGLVIDERARALSADGKPIEGVYAVPGTAGGVHRLHYGGALAACGVFGMIAGDEAASFARRGSIASSLMA